MDNKLFNVNGRDKKRLLEAIKLLLADEYGNEGKVTGWSFHEEKGFIMYWHCESDISKFPIPLSADSICEIVWEWLKTPEANSVKLFQWEEDIDTDGSTYKGWRVYTEDWGHIKKNEHTIDHYTIGAIKPCYCWYGK